MRTFVLASLFLSAAALRVPTRPMKDAGSVRTSPPQPVRAAQLERAPASLSPVTAAETWMLGAAAAMSVALPAGAGDVAWVDPAKAILTPIFAIYTLLFLFRTVLSWFPK